MLYKQTERDEEEKRDSLRLFLNFFFLFFSFFSFFHRTNPVSPSDEIRVAPTSDENSRRGKDWRTQRSLFVVINPFTVTNWQRLERKDSFINSINSSQEINANNRKGYVQKNLKKNIKGTNFTAKCEYW